VGKSKRKRAHRELALATAEVEPAIRHTFSSGGLLGHDLNASSWLVNVSELTALGLDVVQDCVQVIGDAVAGADVGQWNGTERIEPPSGFTLRPDPDMTRRDFLWLFAANLALYKAVWLEEARFAGQVVGVRLHCTASVTTVQGRQYIGGELVRNRMRLVRMAVWPTLDADSGSTIQLAREVFAGAMAANAYTSDYWQQGGSPTLVLKTDQPISGTQADAIQERWVTKRTTSPGQPAVLSHGADVKELGANLGAQGAHISGDKLRASCARYFKMPPGIVNVMSEAGPLTYSTVEQESIHLVRYTIQPYCDVIGEALSAYLPGDYLLGDRIVLDPSKLMMADQLTRFQAWESALRAGWITTDEVRARENLAPNDDLAAIPVGGGVPNGF
jgi:phage portal protein BeeE